MIPEMTWTSFICKRIISLLHSSIPFSCPFILSKCPFFDPGGTTNWMSGKFSVSVCLSTCSCHYWKIKLSWLIWLTHKSFNHISNFVIHSIFSQLRRMWYGLLWFAWRGYSRRYRDPSPGSKNTFHLNWNKFNLRNINDTHCDRG